MQRILPVREPRIDTFRLFPVTRWYPAGLFSEEDPAGRQGKRAIAMGESKRRGDR